MSESRNQSQALEGLIQELQAFLELSFQGNNLSLRDWVKASINPLDSRCWQLQNCAENTCPAYKNECGRCWLIAGTMCGGEVQGKFADKFKSCTECAVYRHAIGADPVKRLREHVIALIHSLRVREEELSETRSELKVLSGLLPICMSCKKIRDDGGYWNQMEKYIHQHSEAQFTHGICPDCIEKLYPGIMDEGK
jgi:hypothetical protein